MGLGGESGADSIAIERDELVGFNGLLPKQHVGRDTVIDAPGDEDPQERTLTQSTKDPLLKDLCVIWAATKIGVRKKV